MNKIRVGINGFGRIGKCVFLQLLENPNFYICAINAPDISIEELEDYLNYDSIHHYDKNMKIELIDNDTFRLCGHTIQFFHERNAKNICWNCEYLIDATGAYLTTPKCKEHNAKYVIMSAPAKDKETPTFIYGVNHDFYNGEHVVSGSSCTTNCLAPMLKLLEEYCGIESCVFTTVHATTSSQYVIDIANKKNRTCRGTFNNIIPHTTGASSSVTAVLPQLKGVIHGTSLRVPVSNVSIVDLNVVLLKDNHLHLEDICNIIKSHPLNKIVYDVTEKHLVSSDFLTTTTPTILDAPASIEMRNGSFKLMIWYDNEWSYSAQLIRLVEHMAKHNNHI
jgi:glyceraldehyde 3-phosphate dehydrogenase